MQLSMLSNDGQVARVQCAGQITQNDLEPGQDPLEGLLGEGVFGRKVLMNLERTNYIDSSGISWLIISHKHFLQGGGKLVLHSIPPLVNQVLQVLRMPLVLHIAKDEAAAWAVVLGDKQ